MAAGQNPSCLDGVGENVQRLYRGFPVDAAVGDALAVDQRLARHDILTARDQVTLHHDAGDAGLAVGYLAGDICSDERLVLGLFAAVGVAGIDHDPRRHA